MIKQKIFSGDLKQNRIDVILSNFFSETKRLVSADKIIPIQQILYSKSEVVDQYFVKPELILRLFLFFQPFSKSNSNYLENKCKFNKLIVNKIFEQTKSNAEEQIFFSHKVRFALKYFHKILLELRNIKAMCYLRFLFILN